MRPAKSEVSNSHIVKITVKGNKPMTGNMSVLLSKMAVCLAMLEHASPSLHKLCHHSEGQHPSLKL